LDWFSATFADKVENDLSTLEIALERLLYTSGNLLRTNQNYIDKKEKEDPSGSDENNIEIHVLE